MANFRFHLAPAILLIQISSLSAQSCIGTVRSEFRNVRDSTGNRGLDEDFIRNVQDIQRLFGVRAGFFIGDEDAGYNAETFSCGVLPHTRETVVFGTTMLLREYALGGLPNAAVPAIMAHEFGHVAQLERGGTLKGAERELQADYLAGWYIARLVEPYRTRDAALVQTLNAFAELGDKSPEGRDPHGSPEARSAAVNAGMLQFRNDFDTAYQASSELYGGVAQTKRRRRPSEPPQTEETSDAGGDRTLSDGIQKIFSLMEGGNFRSVRSSETDGNSVGTTSTLTLPGAKRCYLMQSALMIGGYSYICEFNVNGREEGHDVIEKLSTAIMALPNAEGHEGEGTNTRLHYTFPDSSSFNVSYGGGDTVYLRAWPHTRN